MHSRQTAYLIRIGIAMAIGGLSGYCCWWRMVHDQVGAGDFSWAYQGAQDLLAARDPYQQTPSAEWIPYPLPAALVALPLVLLKLSPEAAAGVFFGISSLIMAFALLRSGYPALLAFLSCPYWVAMQWAQWSPLIIASATFSAVGFVLVVKPHIASPIALAYGKKLSFVSAGIALALSLIIYPRWPLIWISQLSKFQHYLALLTIPGPLLLLALPYWRHTDARLLLAASVFPQRWFYDALILWTIPKTRKEYLYMSAWSWLAYVWRLYHMPRTTVELGILCVVSFYLPALLIVLRRHRSREPGQMRRPILI